MRRLILSAAAALSLLGACATPAQVSPSAPAGMVSTADPRASAAGAEMLRQGGSAADAALAVLLALTVVEPQSSGIGGGGFLVYADRGGPPSTYDGRETAPMAATGTWFFKDGKPMEYRDAVPGGKSVGVPGNLRLMAAAHRDQGRLPWAKLFEPAIRLARDGFVVTPRLNRFLERSQRTGALTEQGRAIFYPGGKPAAAGTTVRNPSLASFLEQLAAQGPDAFYVGPNAQAIVATVNNAAQNPSQMALGDLASYDAKPRQAVCGEYRRHRICGMGPPSSGGTTVFAILKQLERFDIGRLGPRSPTSWHLLAESMRLAFADREYFIADPDFQPVPTAGLIDPGYLATRSALIAPDRTMQIVSFGNPPGATITVCPRVPAAEQGTSHFVAVDRWGDVASLTSTIESTFGSGLVVNGYYLNTELTDFSLSPTSHDCPVANRVEPGKRPRSSMAPTIVYGPDGKVRLAVGAAGGSTIIAQVAKAIIGVVDWKLSAHDAIALPILFAPEDTVWIEQGSSLEAMAPQLRALGHDVRSRELPTKANAVEWRGGRWVGAADPRSEGAVVPQ